MVETDKTCPRCTIFLERRALHEVVIDVCPDCQGVWLDTDELHAALTKAHNLGWFARRRVRKELEKGDVPPEEEFLQCAMCRSPMGRRNPLAEVDLRIDVCKKHGVWMDTGELQAAQLLSEEKGKLYLILRDLQGGL